MRGRGLDFVTFEKCVDQAKHVETDVQSAGFIIDNDKSVWCRANVYFVWDCCGILLKG